MVLAHEVVHALNKNKQGFRKVWVDHIIMCFSSTLVDIFVNCHIRDYFTMRKGLWHVTPTSLYLFIVVIEILEKKIQKRMDSKIIKAPKIIRVGPCFVILKFSNYVLIFTKTDQKFVYEVKDCFKCLQDSVGLRVNPYKFSWWHASNIKKR
ncbi:hypothetical protein EJ110_NYTH05733 [Nymphaea thermarum]|nr:hypothetical protein EJ110_NYTH05733 [Nymphaea thermarum]